MKIVILSRKPDTLIPCVESIFKNEPNFSHDKIIVVEDGNAVGMEKAKTLFPDITWLKGPIPFINSRNWNIGVTTADDDCMVLNDDTTLETFEGFTKTAKASHDSAHVGLISVAIEGRCGHGEQRRVSDSNTMRPMPGGRIATIAFFLPKKTYKLVGPFDETFTKYGFDDDDYCIRTCEKGLWICTYDGCLVKHWEDRMTYHGPEALNGITHWYDGTNSDVFYKKYPRR
jgi:GT2 family glycosyltransferase